MSSCFTVDVSCTQADCIKRLCLYQYAFMSVIRKHMAIIAGSGSYQHSTMHTGAGNVNYVSYYVRRIHFEAEFSVIRQFTYPSYAVLFKVPYKEPLIDDRFNTIKDFILYKEPEKVLGYDISRSTVVAPVAGKLRFDIDIKKPFIVGPNDYVGVFYLIPCNDNEAGFKLGGSAKVWFDPV